jgi:hypothetical protein
MTPAPSDPESPCAEQLLSDQEQRRADREQVRSDRDQEQSDRDQVLSDQDFANGGSGEAWARSKGMREEGTEARSANSDLRAQSGRDRDIATHVRRAVAFVGRL